MKDFCLSKDTITKLFKTCMELAQSGKRYRVKITEWKDERTLSQNRLMWKWMSEIANSVPVDNEYFDHETWHAYFKRWYCPTKIIVLPRGTDSVKSTKLLDKGEMNHYLNKIEMWAMDKDINLTTPDNCEYTILQMEQER